MRRLSIELVPRDEQELRDDLAVVKDCARSVDIINIPDLLRLSIRSWQGAGIVKEYFDTAMPHIRAMDIDLDKELPMKGALRQNRIHDVLVIEGDPPQDMTHEVYPTTSVDVIRKFREEMPDVRVYAGIDQYRGSLAQEFYRVRRKLQAGAAGFFTQPFFDIHFLRVYEDMLHGIEVFWGVSPVTSLRAQNYWERKNQTIFPQDFSPTLDWNIAFTRRIIEYTKEHNTNLYLMPIKANLRSYLAGVLTE